MVGFVLDQPGVGLFDERVPMPQADVNPILGTAGLVQPPFELRRHVHRDADCGRLSAGRPVALPYLSHELRRSGTTATHVEKEWFDVLQTVGASHGHQQHCKWLRHSGDHPLVLFSSRRRDAVIVPERPRRYLMLSLWMMLIAASTCSTGVVGRIPCPRLNTCPLRPPARRKMSSTRRSISWRGA